MTELCIIGIGPGGPGGITREAYEALRECQVIIGYRVYVELVRVLCPDKEYITSAMTEEAKRCRLAIDTALSGKRTAVICSGDSGVYGMAALAYELRGGSSEPDIRVIPGVTAALSGGALLGAPLTDDFAAISLSDRLTDWETIEKRLEAAAMADFAIALYNPASKSRPRGLSRACDILLRRLPESRPCGIARNIGREGESRRILTLGELKNAETDMFCTVFIGSSKTKVIAGKLITPRGYRDV